MTRDQVQPGTRVTWTDHTGQHTGMILTELLPRDDKAFVTWVDQHGVGQHDFVLIDLLQPASEAGR